MDTKEVGLAFQDFIENMKPSLEFRFNQRTWRLVRVPIKGDLAAIYGGYGFGEEGRYNFDAEKMEFMAFTKGSRAFGDFPYYSFGFDLGSPDWLWDKKKFSSALMDEAISIVRAGGLDESIEVPEQIVTEDAKRIFLGKDINRELPEFEKAGSETKLMVLDKMPDMTAAAEGWLQQLAPGWNKQTVRDIIMKRLVEEERAKKVAQSWENDPGSDIFVLREILHSIPKDAKNVDIVYAGPNGLVTTKIPTHAFSAYVGNELKCQVNWNYVTPREECRRVERELRSPGNSMAADSISGVVKITYRGKTVYEK